MSAFLDRIKERAKADKKTVILPESIVQIGEAAFYKTTNLSSIVIANKDVNIENYALASVKLIYLAGSINSSWPEKWYDMQLSYIQENVDVRTIKFDGEYEYFIKNKDVWWILKILDELIYLLFLRLVRYVYDIYFLYILYHC